MLDNLLFSLNTVAPIFVIVILGALLSKFKFFEGSFLSACDRVVFKICLPCLIFQDVATANLEEGFDLKLILFSTAAVVIMAFLLCLTVPFFVHDNAKRGAFIQGAYRSNSAILGVTLAYNMFGESGTTTIAMILPFVVALYNVFAVVILSVFAPSEAKLSPTALAKKIGKSIITNPLIISIILALVWQLLPIPEMPVLMDRSLSYLADMAMPLALISLGGNFRLESLRGRLSLAIVSSAVKTAVIPLVTILAAALIGIRGVELGIVFIIFGGPTAVSSYIMAKEMKSDYELAGQVLLISTLMSIITLFAGIFILKEMSLI